MKQVQVGDSSVAVVDRGEGQTLLLVHGFPLTHDMWREQIEYFSQSRRVIAPDLRGFGATPLGSGPSTMEAMADDLAQLLVALGVDEPVVFCGLSMGGYIGWEFVRKHRPRLAGLIQCDTRAVADTEEVAKGRRILAAKVLAEGATAAAEAMLPKLFAPTTYERRPELVAAIRQMIESNPPQAIAAALEGLATRRDARPMLGSIDVPALLLVGQHDAISTVDEMRQIASEMPGALLLPIPDAGHLAPLENLQATNAAIDEFLLSIATAR